MYDRINKWNTLVSVPNPWPAPFVPRNFTYLTPSQLSMMPMSFMIKWPFRRVGRVRAGRKVSVFDQGPFNVGEPLQFGSETFYSTSTTASLYSEQPTPGQACLQPAAQSSTVPPLLTCHLCANPSVVGLEIGKIKFFLAM
jgi:hypothetical protein